MNSPIKLKCRVWFERDSEYAFGQGTAFLLLKIKELGSLKKAAENLNMPYRGAWGRIKKAEKTLGIPLVRENGSRQQGVSLTDEAQKLVEKFFFVQDACKNILDDKKGEFSFFEN